ncbi:MAG: sulfur oxidation c-type cytochrome SoxX [Polaromonas sp.]|nr:sulfur oxidation c-type cytochrome SoxX [Polaromonas sp.]
MVAAQELPYAVAGDTIPTSLTGVPGDAANGRAIITNRQVGLCLLCHTGPFPEVRFQGNLAPNMSGAGLRWSEGQLRLRLVDASRLNAASVMPAYYRTAGLSRVASAAQGKPLLAAQQLEDVVAFLRTLKE